MLTSLGQSVNVSFLNAFRETKAEKKPKLPGPMIWCSQAETRHMSWVGSSAEETPFVAR